ncbi:MAG: hypothetical protein IH586_14905 [Anaerolineaceae bacterium]|nr:hypothetical protein [Anaerolineaceae bacterium]
MAISLAYSSFSVEDQKAFEPAMKIGLLATVTPAGLPHLTLISSLKAGSASTVNWGQFTEGLSKQHILRNPNTAFLIMSLDKQLWRGKAVWTHSKNGGAEYEWFNNIPMFRYNAYFGIHTVHFMDLVGHTGRQALPMNRIVLAALKTMFARSLSPARKSQVVLNNWTRSFFNKLDNLKFLATLDQDGFPWIIPVIQAQAGDGEHVLLSTSVFRDELEAISPGSPTAILGMALSMEDVLVRGRYEGIKTRAGMRCASVSVDWVYNPMPPVPGQIYPQTELKTITEF